MSDTDNSAVINQSVESTKMSSANFTSSNYYDYLFVDLADPRTNSWFLMKDPGPPLCIIIFYLYFILSLGPRLMEKRKPFAINKLMIVYNLFQVIFSTWLFAEALDGAWWNRYSWRCEPVDFSYSPHALRVARGVYIYFVCKLTELLDTVFFVLRKKYNQITFLHLYHHAGMVAMSWGATKYYPGGHGTFVGLINSFVHIVMYTYYMLAACGPAFQKHLWWKKYITTLQLAQFCICFIHNGQLLFYDCGYPWWSMFFTLPNAVFFYYLFHDFYNKAYTPLNGGPSKNKSGGIKKVADKVQLYDNNSTLTKSD